MKCLRLFISGSVQGVGFRWHVCRVAEQIGGVTGFVRNLPDGRVEILIEGVEKKPQEFLSELENGRLSRNISRIEKTEEPVTGQYPDFSITF